MSNVTKGDICIPFQPSFCQDFWWPTSLSFSFPIDFQVRIFDVFLANVYLWKPSNFENILLQKRPKKRLGNYPLQKTVKNRETSELECLFFVDEKRRPKGKGTREFVIRVFEIHPEKFFFLQILEKWPKWDLFGDIFHALCWWWKKKNGEWHLFFEDSSAHVEFGMTCFLTHARKQRLECVTRHHLKR